MGANEKVQATFHPSLEPNPWTNEDRNVVRDAVGAIGVPLISWSHPTMGEVADAVLAALAPRLVERERAAAVKALRDEANSIVHPDVANWLHASANRIEREPR